MSYDFFVKGKVKFGNGALDELSEILKSYSMKSVMIVHGQSVKSAGIADRVIAQTKEAGVEYVIYDGVIPNPTNEVVEEAAKLAKEANVDGFVAVGGGSCIDLAKAANILMTNEGSIGDFGGMNMVKNPCLPLIAIPTTAGTSTEVTNVSALTDTQKVIKYVIIDNNIVPSDVICDPQLLKSVPAGVMAATGMDAITHAVESYISNVASPLTEYNALSALKIFYDNIVPAVGGDDTAREQMMLGCVIVGFSFSNANLGLVHGIAHTLSAHFHLSHGAANACVLPYVMEYNAMACPEKMTELAKAIGLKTSGDINKDKYLISEALLSKCKEINIKTLKEQNIKESDFEMLAEDVLKEPVLGFNPRQGITKDDVIDILRKAL